MSVWLVLRAAGTASLWLLVFCQLAGYAQRWAASHRPRWVPALGYLHGSLAFAGWAAALAHMWLLRYDGYLPFSWKALLVPFQAPYRPFWTGLGILAMYGWAWVLLSFDGRRRLGARPFRLAHRATPLLAVLAGLHALGAGTDRQLPVVKAAALAAVGLACATLVLPARNRPAQRAGPWTADLLRQGANGIPGWHAGAARRG